MTNPIHTSKSSIGIDPRRRGHGRVTLAEVASHAGVTTMTVSRYLRSPERVASQTSQRISEALQHTGYSPNLQAGSLASGRSQAVAVIVPNLTHSIFADTLHGLGLGLQAEGLHMLVSSTGYSLALEEQQVCTVLGWAPAAVVVTGRLHNPRTQHLLLAAQSRGIPVVEIWDQSPEGEPHDFQQIGFDHAHVGAVMACALIERGYKRLCFVNSGVEEDFRAHDRAQGFVAKANALGIQADVMRAEQGEAIEMGRACFERWHAQQGRLRAPFENSQYFRQAPFICGFGFANDLLATGAFLTAQKLGYMSPSEIGMIGFGDFPIGRYCMGGLNTMHIDGERMGQICAEYIAKQLSAGSPMAVQALLAQPVGQVVLQPRLLWRDCA